MFETPKGHGIRYSRGMTELSDEARTFFREAAGRRKRKSRACAVCGATIPAALTWQLYCSRACKQKAVRQRQRAQQT
jgi:hypothetical protein